MSKAFKVHFTAAIFNCEPVVFFCLEDKFAEAATRLQYKGNMSFKSAQHLEKKLDIKVLKFEHIF
jgi:hypothetical protein